MNKNLKWKIALIVKILVIVVMLIFFFPIKSYTYITHYIPSETYKIKINKITKTLSGEFYHSCSAVDCDNSIYKCSIKLKKNEYVKIMKLWSDKETLSPILENLCENDKIFYESFEDSYENNIEDYNKIDLNSDGKVTSREFGNQLLIDAINEK